MKFRTKLMIIFVGMAVLTNGYLTALTYLKTSREMYREIQLRVMSIAATGAAWVDGDAHAAMAKNGGGKSPQYHRLWKQMRAIRDANRGAGTQLKFVYTLLPPPGGKGPVKFALDAEDPDSEDKSNYGDVLDDFKLDWDISKPHADSEYDTDKWGTWLSGYAPIKDRSGRTVAVLGVDMRASEVKDRLRGVLMQGLLSMCVIAGIALFFSFILSTSMAGPLDRLRRMLEEIRGGRYDVAMEAAADDEFGEVGKAVGLMAAGLREREMMSAALRKQISESAGFDPGAGGRKTRVTALCCDMRGAVAFAATLPADAGAAAMDEFVSAALDAIFSAGGTIESHGGGAITAVFGAPGDDHAQESRAAGAAVAISNAALEIRAKLRAPEGVLPGIGIAAGDGAAGEVAPGRHTFAAPGPAASAARLAAAAGAGILVSEQTAGALKGAYRLSDAREIADGEKTTAARALLP